MGPKYVVGAGCEREVAHVGDLGVCGVCLLQRRGAWHDQGKRGRMRLGSLKCFPPCCETLDMCVPMARTWNWQEGVAGGSFPNKLKLVWLEEGRSPEGKWQTTPLWAELPGGGTQGSCLPTYLAWVSFSLGDISPGGYSPSPAEQNQHDSGLVCCHHDLRPVPNLTVEIVLLVVSWLSGAQEIKLLRRRKSIQPK